MERGNVDVLQGEQEEDTTRDVERVNKWLEGKTWRVREGIDESWDDLQ